MCAKELLKLKNIKVKNTLSALNVLRIKDSLSRVELAGELNCPGTAVTRITRDLIAQGVLKTAGMVESNGGRPREKIELNADWKNAIGIELSPRHITGILTNLKGRVLVREKIFLNDNPTKEEFLNSLELVSGSLLKSCEQEKLLGVGIVTFGPFSGENKILERVTSYPTLDKFNISEFFEEKFKITPKITDATYSKALYEIWFNSAVSKNSFLLFDVGAGIGCAIALEGKIAFSRFSNIGEFGHTIYKLDGDKCTCGKRGCLETLCSIGVVEKKVKEKIGRSLKFSDIAGEYKSGNTQFNDIIEECAQWLGIAIANQVNFLIPEEIILTGEIFQLGEGFFKKIIDTVKEYAFPVFLKELTFTKSESWNESAALGAASLLVRKVFENIKYIEGR